MKPILVALVAVILWNEALTGVVLWQRQQILDSQADISALNTDLAATHTQLEKVTKGLNKTTKAINQQKTWDSDAEDVFKAIIKVLKEGSDEPDAKPSSLKMDRADSDWPSFFEVTVVK